VKNKNSHVRVSTNRFFTRYFADRKIESEKMKNTLALCRSFQLSKTVF